MHRRRYLDKPTQPGGHRHRVQEGGLFHWSSLRLSVKGKIIGPFGLTLVFKVYTKRVYVACWAQWLVIKATLLTRMVEPKTRFSEGAKRILG